MTWREAFLTQAISEHRLMQSLSTGVEFLHRLHYIQMVTEKLSKGLMAAPTDPNPPKPTHAALVRMLQTLKGQRQIQEQLGFVDASVFRAYINSLLVIADKVEKLAPSSAGFYQANPEYPWRDRATNEISPPVMHAFTDFNNLAMVRLQGLIANLIRISPWRLSGQK